MTPVTAPDGTRLSTVATGLAGAPTIVLIHGWAQQISCWRPVIERLADRFHIVAFDLRGHGASGKPEETTAYTDTPTWGADVNAVIEAFALTRPVLVGWSYGARVIAAHIASCGSTHLSGVVTVGGILAIGRSRPDWMTGQASPGSNRDLYTDDLSRMIPATAAFVEACTAAPLPRRTYAEMVGANMLCPPHVRRALFAADEDFSATFSAMHCPGLVIHGTEDAVVPPTVGEAIAKLMPNGRYLPYDATGHAPFLEDPDRFASDLAQFVTEVT